jgi:hypothetical protein
MGFAAMPQMIHQSAEFIMNSSRAPHEQQTLSRDWVSRFLKAHPELIKKKQKSQDVDRITAQKIEEIELWFRKYRKVVAEEGLIPSDIWNFDETGFRVGCGGNQIVVTYGTQKKGKIRLDIASETNRDYLTSVEAVNADGEVILPLLILKAKQHLHQWYNHTEIPGDYYLGVSDTGYTNDELSIAWIKHFNKFSSRLQKGAKRLLLFDGFGGHMTKQFLEICESEAIIPFALPPHTSHMLQPLDVGAFQLYKHWHRRSPYATPALISTR